MVFLKTIRTEIGGRNFFRAELFVVLILQTFAHNSVKEELLFLLLMTVVLKSCDFIFPTIASTSLILLLITQEI